MVSLFLFFKLQMLTLLPLFCSTAHQDCLDVAARTQGLASSERVLSFDSDMLTRVGNIAASTMTELEAFMERFDHKKYSARLAPWFWSLEGPQADFRLFSVQQDYHSAGSISGTLW